MSRDARGRFAIGGRPHNRARHIYVEEVELLLGTDSPENIARRLGLKPASLARALEREGRGDIAREFSAWKQRTRAGYVRPEKREAA